jgi:hypothetical protein
MQHMKPSLYQRWARRLIACYPAGWRQRYAEEMLLILEDSPPTFKTVVDLFLNLLDAYLHQNLAKERTPYMLQRMRANGLIIYSAALIFFVAWFVVQAHFVDPGQAGVLFRNVSADQSLPQNILHSVAYLLPLLMLLGGLPMLLAACWQALRGRRVGTLLLCLIALVSPLVVVVAIVLIWPLGGFFMPFSMVIGLGMSLALISFSVQRVTPGRRITHYALVLAAVLPVVMLISLVALLLIVVPQLVTLFLAGDAILYVFREDLLILIMVGMLVLSLLSLKKGRQARRAVRYDL